MKRSLRGWVPVVALGAVMAIGLVELLLYGWLSRRAPSFDAYETLAAEVGSFGTPGALVAVAPRWAEPMVRRALGPERMPLAHVAAPDLLGHEQAIEISLHGARDPRLAGWQELSRVERGPFALRRLQNPASEPVVADLVDWLEPTRASVTFAGRPCTFATNAPLRAGGLGGHPTFPPERFLCDRSNLFFNVGVTVIADEDFAPRRCVWAHPPARGELTIRFHDVPLGAKLIGHGGMYWMVERNRSGAPIHLTARVGGLEVGRYTHVDGDGWSPFVFEVPAAGDGQRADVEIAVSSPDNRHRHFCLEARMVGARAEGAP